MLASSSTQASAARTLTASERAALAADRARIADIDIRVPEMEHALRTLREERDILRNRLDVYTYPVLTLPNEIVSQIFIQFLPVCPKCPPIFGLHSPNLLAHICGKWREIALSVPALWRGFAVPLAHAVPMARTLTLFDKFVKRSGSFPLSMELAQGSSSLDGINPLLGPASAHDHRGRWEHLNLKIPNFYLIPIHGPLPLLRSLHLAMLPRTGSLPLAPLLTNVSLITHFNNFSPTILPWSQLTSLAVSVISMALCVDVLNATGNLLYCRLGLHCSLSSEPPSRHIIHPRLQSLILCTIGTPHLAPHGGFLDILTLPALRRLWVAESLLQRRPSTVLESLMSRSECSLEQLCIIESGHGLRRSVYHTAFSTLPSSVSVGFKRITGPQRDEIEDAADDEDCRWTARWKCVIRE